MAGKIKYLKIYDLAKGTNVYARDTMLKKEETALSTNVIPTGKASVNKRGGTATFCTVHSSAPIDGLGTHYTNSVRQMLAMCNGTLYRVDSGTAVAVSAAPASAGTFTAGLRTDFCQGGANVYISNGTDEMRVYDGTTVRTQTNGVIAKYMIYYKNCLYASGNTTYPSRLYRSGADTYIGDFTYTTANPLATSINISNNDGQDITSFFKHEDYLYVTKNKASYRVSVAADTTATLSYETVDPARGADSHWATDAVENDVFFFNENGVHAIGYEPNYLDQIRTKVVSLRVDPYIKAIDKSYVDDAAAIYFDNIYYFSYQGGTSTYNNEMLAYDRLRSGWWSYDLGARCFCEFKDSNGYSKLYFGSGADGKIYYFDSSLKTDSGNAFRSVWTSPKYAMDDYQQSKFLLHILFYMGKKPGDVTFYGYVDGTLIRTKVVELGSTGYAGIGVGAIGVEPIGVGAGSLTVSDQGGSDIVKLALNKMGRNVQVTIEDNSATKGWELNAIEIAHSQINKMFQPNVK